MFKKITTLLLVLSCIYTGKTQELQFNQWEFAPALMNPALTGAYSGSFRVGAIVKDGWSSSIASRSWKSTEAFIDAPIIRGFRKSDWIGVGIAFDMDQAGASRFNQQYQRASIAYHLGFGKKYKSTFTIGGQFTNVTITAKDENLTTENSLTNGGDRTGLDTYFANAMNPGEISGSTSRWMGGIGYKSQVNKRNSWGFGLSVGQFLENNRSLGAGGGADELPMRFIAHIDFKSITGKKTFFEPRAVFTKQQGSTKLFLQGLFGYMLKKDLVFKYGAGINTLAALNVPLYAGIEKGRLKVGLAYSVSLAELEATSTYGGLELAASYIHILAKKPKPKPILVCPRL